MYNSEIMLSVFLKTSTIISSVSEIVYKNIK